ncbi:DUF4870 domain-containing protein [Subsaximicrobium wynnwilliamsii]|uniref:DUF4870 domain-containing protein n=1 Tax=Subsaximicrobium wynnwilliamsii TaxID=291179 RepID=A0A5C6ZMC3_9FLAO|nr:DJ-1/PfpI family protein [Subsaximicrobium wynnwilliamsii]TXD85475.1 DUF4870 domain-containing protein [Subsaximicrobium wynnwilliamsii]TXD90828.1 DUF4870 domain-containing protein [Subsaximicrobium wynnwilliamsii]TXE05335.1 DUF4870 domain-containing protein [Subsaximicrobium wynnwilliamsii]
MEKQTIGKKLAYQRKLKGYTQDILSEKSNVAIRTIQRIEKDEVNPQLQTIKLLADALKIEVDDLIILENPKEEALQNKWLLFLHGSPLLGFIFPFSVLFPLFIWLHKRDDNPIYNQHGIKIINFQLSVTILYILAFISLVTVEGWGFLFFIAVVPFNILVISYNLFKAITAQKCYYPLSFPFLKTNTKKHLKKPFQLLSITAILTIMILCVSFTNKNKYYKGIISNNLSDSILTSKQTLEVNKIAFYLQDGVEVLDFSGPMEVFAYAGYEIFIVSKTTHPITTQGIMKIIPQYSIKNAPSADILAFFGGNSSEAYKDIEVINWVKSQNSTKYYFSVCTGAFILAESDILKGKTATTFHNALDEFEYKYPETTVLKNIRFVDNGNVITTAGISAGIDGALHLVAKLKGFNAARKVAYYMEYDKWIPGEGLILSDDNPYKNFIGNGKFDDYVGIYEFQNNTDIILKVNSNEQSLYAKVNGRNYPIFFIKDNIFLNVDEEKIIFERNSNDEILGFKAAEKNSKFYAKLN